MIDSKSHTKNTHLMNKNHTSYSPFYININKLDGKELLNSYEHRFNPTLCLTSIAFIMPVIHMRGAPLFKRAL